MGIDSLPNELLADIIQRLPWRDRLCVEGVNSRWRDTAFTKGWAHVKRFSNTDYTPYRPDRKQLYTEKMSLLLDRCSQSVETIHLDGIGRLQIQTLLDRHPKVSRIELHSVDVNKELVDHLHARCNRVGVAPLRWGF